MSGYPQSPMGWVDTHCHLQLDRRDPAQLLDRAPGVDWVVVPGVDAESSQAAAGLAKRFPDRVVATAGLHPHEAARWPFERDQIGALAAEAAAVGEAGLDFYRNLSAPEDQINCLVEQIKLARNLAKPIVIHCRDAFRETYDQLARADLGDQVVLHCWTGGRKWTKRFLPLGCWFSFAGPIAFETGETIRLAAGLVPPDRALIETDTPYLAPPPHRHELNEPAFVSFVGEALARVWSMPAAEVAAATSENARKVFVR